MLLSLPFHHGLSYSFGGCLDERLRAVLEQATDRADSVAQLLFFAPRQQDA